MFIFSSSEQTLEIGLSGLILSDFLYITNCLCKVLKKYLQCSTYDIFLNPDPNSLCIKVLSW